MENRNSIENINETTKEDINKLNKIYKYLIFDNDKKKKKYRKKLDKLLELINDPNLADEVFNNE